MAWVWAGKMSDQQQPGRRGTMPANLTPELRQFIDRAVVPALLDRFLAEMRQNRQDSTAARDTAAAPASTVQSLRP
jgi:hypothetical protein